MSAKFQARAWTTNLPVFPTLCIDDTPVGERHEELAGLILDIDEAGYEVVNVLDGRNLCLVDIPERHGGQWAGVPSICGPADAASPLCMLAVMRRAA